MSTVHRKTSLLQTAAAFLIGVAGTAAFVFATRKPPTNSSPPPASVEAPASGDERGRITLSEDAAKNAGIRVEPARLALVGDSLIVPGIVEVSPNRGAKITPPAAGKVIRLLVNPGDRVRAGQSLLVLDSVEVAQARASVKQAEANVEQARAVLETARADTGQVRGGIGQAQADVDQARTRQTSAETALSRQKELAAAGAFSQAPVQAAQSELSASQSELLTAQTDLQAHTVSLERAERLFKEELISRAELEQTQLEQRQDQTRVQQAQTRVSLAKQALEREQKVFRGDLLSKQAVQTAEAEARAAAGDVQKARQGLLRAQEDTHRAERAEQAAGTALRGAESALTVAHANLYALVGASQEEIGGLLTLTAPIAGTVTERNATLGESVERSTTLCVIENLNTVQVNANVPEKNVGRIRVGERVEVTVSAYPDQTFSGVVQSVAGGVEEKTRALPVRCLVQNPGGRLKPEMFANVSLDIGARVKALSVPVSALDEDGDAHYLYVEEEGGFERRKVEIGRKTETTIEVLSGVKLGEKVVTSGVFVLKSESKKGELKGDSD